MDKKGDLFGGLTGLPLAQRVLGLARKGGVLYWPGVAPVAAPFAAAWIRSLLPDRAMVIVTENVKAQERFQQDLDTWLGQTGLAPSLFFPSWEILPNPTIGP